MSGPGFTPEAPADHERLVREFFVKSGVHPKTVRSMDLPTGVEIPVGLEVIPDDIAFSAPFSDDTIVDVIVVRDAVHDAVDRGRLSQRELGVLAQRHMLEKTLEETGAVLGDITGQRVRQIEGRAHATLRYNYFEHDESPVPTATTLDVTVEEPMPMPMPLPKRRQATTPPPTPAEEQPISEPESPIEIQADKKLNRVGRHLAKAAVAAAVIVAGISLGVRPKSETPLPSTAQPVPQGVAYWDSSRANCVTGAGHIGQPATNEGEQITSLVAESGGRIGPVNFLQEHRDQWPNIDYVLLYDPGSLEDFATGCDRQLQEGKVIKEWLASNPKNQLTVLAGKQTADYSHRVNGFAHAGIQNYLFSELHNTPQARQIAVCNYDDLGPGEVLKDFADAMGQAKITAAACPALPSRPAPAAWDPGSK